MACTSCKEDSHPVEEPQAARRVGPWPDLRKVTLWPLAALLRSLLTMLVPPVLAPSLHYNPGAS